MVVLGLAIFLGICWAVGRGIEQAANKVGEINRTHKAAWRKKHPKAVAAARWGGLAAAVIHGTPVMLRAFRRDWNEHYGGKRDEVREKYGYPPKREPEPAPARPSTDPAWKPQPTKRTEPRPAPAAAPSPPQPAVGTAPVRPNLRVVPNGSTTAPATTKGQATMPADVTREINGVAGLHDYLADAVATAEAKFDDASDAAQRARTYLRQVQHASENAPRILNRDPGLASKIAQLIEPAQQDVKNEEAREQIAADQLEGARAALTDLAVHLKTAEAVQQNPNVSTNTTVYQDA